MKVKEKKKEAGFTLVELVMVVAILGVLGALIVPSFGNILAKSRVSTDVTTTQTIKRLIDIYLLDGNPVIGNQNDGAQYIGMQLKNTGYLDSAVIELQTKGKLKYTAATVSATSTLVLDVSGSTESIKAAARTMDTSIQEKWLIGYK